MALFLGTDVINKKSPQDNLASCFYNHNELDLRNGFYTISFFLIFFLFLYSKLLLNA
jgi:hypothetical protein